MKNKKNYDFQLCFLGFCNAINQKPIVTKQRLMLIFRDVNFFFWVFDCNSNFFVALHLQPWICSKPMSITPGCRLPPVNKIRTRALNCVICAFRQCVSGVKGYGTKPSKRKYFKGKQRILLDSYSRCSFSIGAIQMQSL